MMRLVVVVVSTTFQSVVTAPAKLRKRGGTSEFEPVVASTHPLLGAGCGALDGAGAIHHSNELLEPGKLNTVECLCEAICSLVVCADPTNLNGAFVEVIYVDDNDSLSVGMLRDAYIAIQCCKA
jgi:hypothetical protein